MGTLIINSSITSFAFRSEVCLSIAKGPSFLVKIISKPPLYIGNLTFLKTPKPKLEFPLN